MDNGATRNETVCRELDASGDSPAWKKSRQRLVSPQRPPPPKAHVPCRIHPPHDRRLAPAEPPFPPRSVLSGVAPAACRHRLEGGKGRLGGGVQYGDGRVRDVATAPGTRHSEVLRRPLLRRRRAIILEDVGGASLPSPRAPCWTSTRSGRCWRRPWAPSPTWIWHPTATCSVTL